jgi:cell cycle checkpoint protein
VRLERLPGAYGLADWHRCVIYYVRSFNSVPPTSLAKALNRILPLAVPVAAKRPPKDAIQLIVHSSQGDVRSAVNALQFLCRAQIKQGRAAPVKKLTGAGSRGGKPPRGTDKALKSLYVLMIRWQRRLAYERWPVLADFRLDAVTRREQSLILFHALGKVLWNKRASRKPSIRGSLVTDRYVCVRLAGLGDPTQETGEEEDYPPSPPEQIPLPAHLLEFERRQSKVDVEVRLLVDPSMTTCGWNATPCATQTLFKEAPVDTGLFNLYLHQNYPVFCSDIDECAASIEVLSRSDALKTDDDLVRAFASLSRHWASSADPKDLALPVAIITGSHRLCLQYNGPRPPGFAAVSDATVRLFPIPFARAGHARWCFLLFP